MSKSSDGKALWAGIAVAVIFVGLALFIMGRPAKVNPGPNTTAVPNEPTVREQLDAASHYIVKGEFDSAKQILSRLILRHPENAESHLLMAKVLLAEHQPASAYGEVTESIQLNADQADARFFAGTLAYQLGKYQESADHYEAASKLDESDARYLMYLGQALKKLGERDRAHDMAVNAIDRDPSLSDAYVLLAQLKGDRGELDQSIRLFNEAIDRVKHAGRKVTYIVQKAQFLREQGEAEAALSVLNGLEEAHQMISVSVREYARCYLAIGEPDKAAARWAELFTLFPKNAEAAAEAGRCFLKAGNQDKAKLYGQFARRANDAHPSTQALLDELGY